MAHAPRAVLAAVDGTFAAAGTRRLESVSAHWQAAIRALVGSSVQTAAPIPACQPVTVANAVAAARIGDTGAEEPYVAALLLPLLRHNAPALPERHVAGVASMLVRLRGARGSAGLRAAVVALVRGGDATFGDPLRCTKAVGALCDAGAYPELQLLVAAPSAVWRGGPNASHHAVRVLRCLGHAAAASRLSFACPFTDAVVAAVSADIWQLRGAQVATAARAAHQLGEDRGCAALRRHAVGALQTALRGNSVGLAALDASATHIARACPAIAAEAPAAAGAFIRAAWVHHIPPSAVADVASAIPPACAAGGLRCERAAEWLGTRLQHIPSAQAAVLIGAAGRVVEQSLQIDGGDPSGACHAVVRSVVRGAPRVPESALGAALGFFAAAAPLATDPGDAEAAEAVAARALALGGSVDHSVAAVHALLALGRHGRVLLAAAERVPARRAASTLAAAADRGAPPPVVAALARSVLVALEADPSLAGASCRVLGDAAAAGAPLDPRGDLAVTLAAAVTAARGDAAAVVRLVVCLERSCGETPPAAALVFPASLAALPPGAALAIVQGLPFALGLGADGPCAEVLFKAAFAAHKTVAHRGAVSSRNKLAEGGPR